MKNKVLVLPIILAATLAACGKQPEPQQHVHTFSADWSKNEVEHWHEATCEHKDQVSDKGPHDFDQAYRCKVCGYSGFDTKSYYLLTDVGYMKGADYLANVLNVPKEIVDLLPDAVELYKYTFIYKSKDIHNNEVLMSASLTVPYIAGEPSIEGIVVDSHPTLTDLGEAPTARWDQYLINAFASNAILQCDLMGFGIQSDKISDYHCRHLANRNTVDGILACFDILDDKYNTQSDSLPLYNIGYSQGGFTSMGILRYMEQEATEYEKSRIKIKKTISGSGAYDINVMFDECFKIEDYQYCHYLIKGILTTHEYHPDAYGNIKVEDYLTDYGKQFLDPLIKKNDAQLQKVLKAVDKNGYPLYKGPKSVFNQEYLNPESELNKAVVRACDYENLLDGNWYPEGDLDLYYSPYDTMVTPKCSEKAVSMFGSLDNVEVYTAISEIDHRPYGTVFYISTLLEFLLDD